MDTNGSGSGLISSAVPACQEELRIYKISLYIYIYIYIYTYVYSKRYSTVHRRTGHEGPKREKSYSSTLSLSSALEGVGWSTPRPGRYPGERPGTPCIGGWVGPRTGLGGCGKYRPPPGLDPQTVQPVANGYKD
jgi:hypothetical protein